MKEMNEIMTRNKTTSFAMLYPMLVQLPIFTGFYFALHNMCVSSLPSLVADAQPFGFVLTQADPYHALNVSVTATIFLAVRHVLLAKIMVTNLLGRSVQALRNMIRYTDGYLFNCLLKVEMCLFATSHRSHAFRSRELKVVRAALIQCPCEHFESVAPLCSSW
jgi:hypothetical protein